MTDEQKRLQKLIDEIDSIPSIYDEGKIPMCYPGTWLDPDLGQFTAEFIRKQLNLIGTHTYSDVREGGFDKIQNMEIFAIRWIAKLLGGIVAGEGKTDGYFCGGATEANIEGMWLARQWMRSFNNETIVPMYSKTTHYSICKACDILGLNIRDDIKITDKLEMDLEDIETKIIDRISRGYHNFIIIPTAGTYISGAIDPISEINDLIERISTEHEGLHFYIHVDAAFGGFTIPFLAPDLKIGFQNKHVMSMAVDGDKMGLLPYPSGIFLCRNGLQKHITRDVHYIRGAHDDTLSGSRSGLGQACAWYMFNKYGFDGYRQLAQDAIDHRDKLVKLVSELDWGDSPARIQAVAHSPYVNQLPMVIDIKDGKIPDELLESPLLKGYNLRSESFPINGEDVMIYKVCIMRHTYPHIEQFVKDLYSLFSKEHKTVE
jgi:glutamate/tyrosine decarboxylase-like PLP-dependent enzyme